MPAFPSILAGGGVQQAGPPAVLYQPQDSAAAPMRQPGCTESNVTTSKKDASKASTQLKSSKSTGAQKSVAGSDLAQAKKKGAKKK